VHADRVINNTGMVIRLGSPTKITNTLWKEASASLTHILVICKLKL